MIRREVQEKEEFAPFHPEFATTQIAPGNNNQKEQGIPCFFSALTV